MEADVKKIVLEISAYILKLAGCGEDLEENKASALDAIKSRKSIWKIFRAYKKSRWRYRKFRRYTKGKIYRRSKGRKVGVYIKA